MKRDADDDEPLICEGVSAEWQAAARKKRRKTASRSSPLRSLNSSEANRSSKIERGAPYKPHSDWDPPPSSQRDIPASSQYDRPVQHATRINTAPRLKICNCGNSANDVQGVVDCANAAQCLVKVYHKKCVGLGTRNQTTGWRCFGCRPKPPTSSQPSVLSSQAGSAGLPVAGLNSIPASPLPEQTPLIIQGPPEPPLHAEQERVVQAIEHGHNVFYTGSAGTGKSTVLKAFVRKLQNLGKKVDIVAPSGIAALNVQGMTLFHYAYWHPDAFKDPFDALLKKAHGKNIYKRLNSTDVLVIDEISMVERDLFIRLDAVMREIRDGYQAEYGSKQMPRSPHSRKLPFGGAQIVVTGDFCQLPPVKPFRFCMQCGGDELPGWSMQDGRILKCKKCPLTYTDADKWAFRSKAWEDCCFSYFELKQIHRQSDEQFINILQKCRVGKALFASEKALLTTPKPDPTGAVKLLPRRKEVDDENLRNFHRLHGQARAYQCLDVFNWRNEKEPELKKKGAPKYPDRPDGPLLALKDHRFEENVQLKPGMLVILLVNLDFDAGLVNGSQGKIVRFEKYDPKKSLVPKSSRDSSPPPGVRKNAKSSSGVNEHAEYREAQIREFINRAANREWPVVQFSNGETRTIYASCQLSELGSEKPYSLIGRTQIPLLAAWAITIHKSQGMTLDRVILDLYNSFEREMVYVALSRARNLAGLKVVRLARNMELGVNEEVQHFLKAHFDETAPFYTSGQAHAKPRLIKNPDPWEQWRSDVEAAFADYARMQAFPSPPARTCAKASCQTDKGRVLGVCRCNIQAAFERVGDLRKERSRWHPDRFTRCREHSREAFQKMAREVFVVVDAMWQRSEAAATRK